jgi:hypothetical protein
MAISSEVEHSSRAIICRNAFTIILKIFMMKTGTARCALKQHVHA